MTDAADGRPVPEIRLGGLLFSLAQPEAGYERHFHRWYERDHFYAGCMAGANFFAGRRWLATRPLREARFPKETPLTADIRDGSFLVTYWILGERVEETIRWAVDQVLRLHAQGRMEAPRRNISTGFYRYAGGVFQDPDGVPAELALDHPFAATVATMLDAAGDGDALAAWLQEAVLPEAVRESGMAMALCFRPVPLPDDAPDNVARPDADYFRRRVLILSFARQWPCAWDRLPRAAEAALAETGRGELVFTGPFIPTIPGTDTYLDAL